MANFELKFIDAVINTDFIKAESELIFDECENIINISGKCYGECFSIILDKSTAIKFAKTLRTEINKITESEVKNG